MLTSTVNNASLDLGSIQIILAHVLHYFVASLAMMVNAEHVLAHIH